MQQKESLIELLESELCDSDDDIMMQSELIKQLKLMQLSKHRHSTRPWFALTTKSLPRPWVLASLPLLQVPREETRRFCK